MDRGALTPIGSLVGLGGNPKHWEAGDNGLPLVPDGDLDELWPEVAHLVAAAEQHDR